MDARLLVRNFTRGGPCPRPPLAPTAFYHAARLEGGSFEALFYDPTRLTRALLDQQRLLNTDVVAVRFDRLLLAAASDVPVSWDESLPSFDETRLDAVACLAKPDAVVGVAAALLDVVGRLAAELRRQIPVMAVVPGPEVLAGEAAEHLPAAVGLVREFVEGACKAGAEVVLIEAAPNQWEEAAARARISPLANTARYYNAATLVSAPQLPKAKLCDAVVIPESQAAMSAEARLGLTIPADCFQSEAAAQNFAASLRNRSDPVLLTASDAVLVAHSIEQNVALFHTLRSVTFT